MTKNQYPTKKRAVVLVLFSLLAFVFSSKAQTAALNKDSIEVAKTMEGFIEAFTNLKWDAFLDYFADDATVFFPPALEFSMRATGKNEVAKVFSDFFERVKKRKTAPPYLTINPKDLLIQAYPTFAVVSFVLQDANTTNRRSFVLSRRHGSWQIIHLHASAM